MSARPAALPNDSVEPGTGAPATVRWIASRILAFCVVELQKIRHDRSELLTRAIQPALWLLIFGKTFSALHPAPTGGLPYLDFLTPGVLAQSTLFVAVFYGIQVIWERDAGVLAKLLVTPTPRSALVAGKGFAPASGRSCKSSSWSCSRCCSVSRCSWHRGASSVRPPPPWSARRSSPPCR
jgi:ABC-2 type transport system permease protein